MKRFVISGAAFYEFRDALLNFLPTVFGQIDARTTVLDYGTLSIMMSESFQKKIPNSSPHIMITLGGEEREDYLSLFNQIVKFGEEAIHVILDCTMISIEGTYRMLQKMQYDASILNVDIVSVSIICNDALTLEYASALSQYFCIGPLNLNAEELAKVQKKVRRQAWRIRYIDWNPVLRFFLQIYQKIRSIKR